MTEKIDALDLIINVLKEHEKVLDEAIEQLNAIAEKLNAALDEAIEQLNAIAEKLNAVSPKALSLYQANLSVEAIAQSAWTTISGGQIALSSSRKTIATVLIQDFVHALNRRRMIPNGWVEALIERGIKNFENMV